MMPVLPFLIDAIEGAPPGLVWLTAVGDFVDRHHRRRLDRAGGAPMIVMLMLVAGMLALALFFAIGVCAAWGLK